MVLLTVVDAIDFSRLTRVRHLEIGPINLAAIPVILTKYNFPKLEVITFAMWFDWVQFLRRSDYEALEDCLESPEFRNLREVHFLYTGPLKVDKVDARVRRVFSRISSRLYVVVTKVGDIVPPFDPHR